MAKKIHVLKLRADERAELERVVSKGKSAAWKIRRAHALLKCDQGPDGPGWSDQRIAEAHGCSTRCVEKWRMERKARVKPPIAPRLDGEKEARWVALACSQPPEGHMDIAAAGRPAGGAGGGGSDLPRDGAAGAKKK